VPDAAAAFLVSLAEGSRETADAELAGLTALKREHTGNAGTHTYAWDSFDKQQLWSRLWRKLQPPVCYGKSDKPLQAYMGLQFSGLVYA
jgi:hypothetical protein